METVGQRVRALRIANNLSQFGVAEALNMSRPTYMAVEAGTRQLNVNELVILANVFDTSVEDILNVTKKTATKQSDIEIYKDMILNCLEFGSNSDDKRLTKTKLAKLVYLADFTWFYRKHTSMSGMSYRRIDYGPVPDEYFRVIDELFGGNSIQITPSGTALMINLNESQAPKNRLSVEQIDLIKEIATIWKDKNTREIVDFTHSQKPWSSCRPGELVPYELILKESEDHLYQPA